jgi:hypothetical protein
MGCEVVFKGVNKKASLSRFDSKWDHTVENLCDKQGFFCGAKRSKSWTSPDNHRYILSPDNHQDRREPQGGPHSGKPLR